MPTQIDRPFRLKSTLGDDALLLESFEGHERVSTPFRFVLRVLSENPNIDIKGLLYKPVVMSIILSDGKERHIHANIKRVRLLEFGADFMAAYEIEVVPWLWFLNLFTDCAIFQNLSVQEIVEAVFKKRGFSDFRWSLQGSYAKRDYCVQYRETDFNFISRLLEDEGIFYYFEHTREKVDLVLADANSNLEACPRQASARYTPNTGGRLDEDTVLAASEEFDVQIGNTALTDYDFEKPATDLGAVLAGDYKGEWYDYPGGYVTKDQGERYARIRLEERESRIRTLRGEANCKGFECGYKFKLEDYFRDDANAEYIITSLAHKGRNTSYQANADPSAYEYAHRFEAIPADVPLRPPRLARKPVVEGAQTAVVVGLAGEEIWTDEHGRVKVLFHWDRQGKGDEKSSCWIRVAQGWAGKNWGAFHTPRIGQEVIVSFLEGDPDRPIVTGRVYNAVQLPPYELPAEQTKSGVKSMSSKGGGGFNEIRFEDKKGSEQVFLHGEKDLDVRIKNDRKEWIGNDRHLIVGRDKFEKLARDEHNQVGRDRIEKIARHHLLEIAGKEGIKITGDHSLSVQGDVTETFKGNQSTDVTQNLYVKGMQIVIEASAGLTLKVGGSFVTIDPSGVAVKGPMIQLNSAGAALSGSPGQPVPVDPPKDPAEADKANPGGTSSGPPARGAVALELPLISLSPAERAEMHEEIPERTVPTPGPGSGGRGPAPAQEHATFPKHVDPVAVAQALKEAAKSGIPFCEECEKKRQQREGGG